MRSSFTRAVLAGRPTTAPALPRTAAFFPSSSSLRFSSTQSTPPAAQTKPYLVDQTPAGHWPVYKTLKHAGSTQLTVIKKIQGDGRVLADDIAALLAVPRDEVKINPTTRHIRVKGVHVSKVTDFLTSVQGAPDAFKNKQTVAAAEQTD